jgi:two-component sensor histidine kinase
MYELPPRPAMEAVQRLAFEPSIARQSRQVLRHRFEDVLPADLLLDVELVVCELVTNAFIYGEPPVVLHLRCSPIALRVTVCDGSPTLPRLLDPSPRGGFGLRLVDELADEWGAEAAAPGTPGKLVWALLYLAEAARAGG